MATVFVYGTLMRGQRNNYLLQSSKFLKVWRTGAKFKLFSCGDSYPCMVRDTKNGCRINGELWEVDSATLFRLDTLEGHPWMYRRQQITKGTFAGGLWNRVEGYLYQQATDDLKLIGSSWRVYSKNLVNFLLKSGVESLKNSKNNLTGKKM